MASTLTQVLRQFEATSGAVSLGQMARKLRVDPGVLQCMIDYWVRKGKIREVVHESKQCMTCGVQAACPFLMAFPRYYECVSGESKGFESVITACSDNCGCSQS